MTRHILSYHQLPDGRYRAVVVQWDRNRFGIAESSIHRTYTARSIKRVWWSLVFNGYIHESLAHDPAAFNAFRMMGRAVAG